MYEPVNIILFTCTTWSDYLAKILLFLLLFEMTPPSPRKLKKPPMAYNKAFASACLSISVLTLFGLYCLSGCIKDVLLVLDVMISDDGL